jgi:dihydrofolate synthase
MTINLSLDRIRVLTALLPTYTRPTIHVAGTNGKGSVTALLSSILRATEPQLDVGRFNSPHLVTVRDCIVINGHAIDESMYASARDEVQNMDMVHAVGASNFELLTATALLIFERVKVDIAIIEVGMGGRLDATNIIPTECILVSAITAVDLDHQAFLGDTVAAIAREKVAIARQDVPFVLGRQRHPDVSRIVTEAVGGTLVHACNVARTGYMIYSETLAFQSVNFTMSAYPDPLKAPCPLLGDHQLDNIGIAATIVDVLLTHPHCSLLRLRDRTTPASISRGIEETIWRGRLSFHTYALESGHRVNILADGAHNPASAETLAQFIHQWVHMRNKTPLRLTYLLALSHSPPKTPRETLQPLLRARSGAAPPKIAALRFTPPEDMPWVKSVPPSAIATVVKELGSDPDVWAADDEEPVEGQLTKALEWAAEHEEAEGESLTIVAGSLYLVADLYRVMGSNKQL